MISVETIQKLIALLKNQDFVDAAEQCKSNADIAQVAQKFNLAVTEEDLTELLAKKPEAMKTLHEVVDFTKVLKPLLKDEHSYQDFYTITSVRKFEAFCETYHLSPPASILTIADLIFTHLTYAEELSDDDLDAVAGGSFLMSAVKVGVGFIPGIGGIAAAALDVADGSAHGTEGITARLASGAAVSLFSCVSTMSCGGAISIGKQFFKEGLTSAVKQKLAVFGGLSALSGIGNFAVKQALT